MIDTYGTGVWIGRAVYLSVAAILLFLALLPLRFVPSFIPSPDFLACLTLAVALRRPEIVPFWLIAAVFLLGDLLLHRAPGLWTAVMVLTAEWVRGQEYRFRELAFPFEWAFFAGVLFLAILADRVILGAMLVPQPGFGAITLHYLVTVLAYPVVVFFCYVFLRIRKLRPDEAVLLGHRL